MWRFLSTRKRHMGRPGKRRPESATWHKAPRPLPWINPFMTHGNVHPELTSAYPKWCCFNTAVAAALPRTLSSAEDSAGRKLLQFQIVLSYSACRYASFGIGFQEMELELQSQMRS